MEPDAFHVAKAKAAHEKISLGKAVSDLIMQGIRQPPAKTKCSAVFRSAGGIYTSEGVETALDDE